jgi:hypothetical protein
MGTTLTLNSQFSLLYNKHQYVFTPQQMEEQQMYFLLNLTAAWQETPEYPLL